MKKLFLTFIISVFFIILPFPIRAIEVQQIPPSTQSIEISTDQIVTSTFCPDGCTCTESSVSCPAPSIIPIPSAPCPKGCKCDNNLVSCPTEPGNTQVCPIGCQCTNGYVTCQISPFTPTPSATCPSNCKCAGNLMTCSLPPVSNVCPVGCDCSKGISTCPINQKPIDLTIETSINPVPIQILKVNNQLTITNGQVSVSTTEKLIYNGSKLYVDKIEKAKQIKLSPEEALLKIEKITNIQRFTLTQSEQKPVYEISGTNPVKILYVFPVSLTIESKIDANSGEIISVRKPWWSFLVK